MALIGEVVVLVVGFVFAILALIRDWPIWVVLLPALLAIAGLVMLVVGRRQEPGKSRTPSSTFGGEWETLDAEDVDSTAHYLLTGTGRSVKLRRIRHRPRP
jgi:hypothetical protein